METEPAAAALYPEQDPAWLASCAALADFLLHGEVTRPQWEGLEAKTRVAVAAYAAQLIANETPQVVFELLNGLKQVIDPDAPPKSVTFDAVWDGEHIHTYGNRATQSKG